ncbi:AraC family transcriptional regulator [Streptomyces sp. A0592]|uniref:helix-turn-helix transcriptional regulator n=1 Tax=Streptomyces sp. A0592 TaxID=2563099 RepID=UPI001F0CE624|nr:AraC family transcriptional regulator [Streptomyces sp. A0592]
MTTMTVHTAADGTRRSTTPHRRPRPRAVANRRPEPVATMPALLADDSLITTGGHPPHVHDFHQFLYVPLGAITVSALGQDHELTASVALWIPAGVVHSARFGPDAVVVSESFDAALFDLPYVEPTPVNVTDAQHALLLGRMRSSAAEPDDPKAFAALSAAHPDSLPLPQPVSPAALAVARGLARDPSDGRTATQWAAGLYTSSTSLRRAFRAETGMAFSEWRTRLRLNHALYLLDQGQSVGLVAAQVGFVSTNGFILAFRRYFGRTPGSYVQQQAGTTT